MDPENDLAELKTDGAPAVEPEPTEKETPAAPPAADKPEQQEPSQEVKPEPALPFHKHPRWKAQQEKSRLQEQTIEELKKELQSLKQSAPQPKKEEIPAWFVETYGEDQALWSRYQSQEQARRQAIKEEIFRELEQRQQQQTQQSQKWDQWVEGQVAELEAEGLTFDRNELFAIMTKYAPTDGQGNLDFRKGHEILQLKGQPQNPSSAARKALAGKTAPTAGGAAPKGIPIAELRRKSIHDLANES